MGSATKLGTVVAFRLVVAAALTACAAAGDDAPASGSRTRNASGSADTNAALAGSGAEPDGDAPMTGTAGGGDAPLAEPAVPSGTQPPGTPAEGGKEQCGDAVDEDGDLSIDEGCPCEQSGSARVCYVGPPGSEGVGTCKAGSQECIDDLEFDEWGACDGAVVPADDVCDDGIDSDCDGKVDEGCDAPPPLAPPPPPPPPPLVPEACTTATFTHLIGAADCKPNQAVFMIDDGDGPNMICCPLPANDILTAAPAVVRGAQCGANEVITGAVGASNFKCSAINTARYQLAPPMLSCYFGDGVSGAWGVARCMDHPASFTVLANNYFGSDGCSSQPYGALFVQQSGKACMDMFAAQLLYAGTVPGDPPAGTPVDTFRE